MIQSGNCPGKQARNGNTGQIEFARCQRPLERKVQVLPTSSALPALGRSPESRPQGARKAVVALIWWRNPVSGRVTVSFRI